MSAPKGNKYAMKFRTSEERKLLCKKYCEHISQGYSDISFGICDPDTIERYIKNFPEDFPTDYIEDARAERLFFWEKIGVLGTLGIIPKFNGSVWVFQMRNRFGWKMRSDIKSDEERIQLPLVYKSE